MSKLIDRLNQISPAVAQPIGFRTAPASSTKPKMVLIASLAQADGNDPTDYLAGADAGLLPITDLKSGAKALRKIQQVAPNILWGGWLQDTGKDEIEQIAQAGGDFIVFPMSSRLLAIPQNDEVGRILQVGPSLSEGLLRTIDDLPVDAVLVTDEYGENQFLNWQHLMLFRRFTNLLTKPLLVYIPANVTANELQILSEAEVPGIVVEIETGQPTGRLNELRQAIDKLSPPSPHKRKKAEAVLPQITREPDLPVEEEEEDEI